MPGIQQVVGVVSGHGWQLDYDGFSPGRMHIWRHGDTSVHIDYTAGDVQWAHVECWHGVVMTSTDGVADAADRLELVKNWLTTKGLPWHDCGHPRTAR
ncbi:hypothetical protein H7I87_00435 [Mycobacterium timonense]|uniref:Transposase n=2 Tax=Mycobacterium avium complex (MAC) TaxID=120793 RepID=A0AAW5S171_MYCBC|nr:MULTISPECIES: hypothetical protein [Mycobacterium avium complex (MAC)]MCV6988685.1 hypothetical protein [Mycobacterium bouchedurhonense]MCV6993233.1 hypothetical protein [Mycobacterium timonense]MDV3306405.1 hypothetical protein [Mycobacterium avium subsp. hominissuis]ORA45523.1 hypothetical protein BST19_20095 [Mycobacterium bouchedurhonense]ORB77228.1 hypothetical protein BST46_25695 [Mycobacterium timonense]